MVVQYLLFCDYIEVINAMTDLHGYLLIGGVTNNRGMYAGPVGDMDVER